MDLLILDKPEIVSKVEYIHNLGASDHLALFVTLNSEPDLYHRETEIRNYYKGDYNGVRKDLCAIDWSRMQGMTVNDSYDFFVRNIEDYQLICALYLLVLKTCNRRKVSNQVTDVMT